MRQPTEQPRDVKWEIGQDGLDQTHIVTAARWLRDAHPDLGGNGPVTEFLEFSTAAGEVVLAVRAALVQYIRRIG